MIDCNTPFYHWRFRNFFWVFLDFAILFILLGRNGRLGHGNCVDRIDFERIRLLVESTFRCHDPVVHISAGASHSLCVTKSGFVFSFGKGEGGRYAEHLVSFLLSISSHLFSAFFIRLFVSIYIYLLSCFNLLFFNSTLGLELGYLMILYPLLGSHLLVSSIVGGLLNIRFFFHSIVLGYDMSVHTYTILFV